ncbi:MAG: phosphatidylserine/phosphatidylglycerophosphate/cardiolipin synthase family protein [Sphingomonas sp.]|uniref:phospholipase D-like domain-containing protein n=1 Tax=Sphingomonas sp. TaxID=28214 RepID=UPI00260D6506|nr:phosphatidylserine/phosphatidylglycerophosphate/cardiolipin synthase family protein [Sphingomonas sp.]MDK2768188.1 phosphatidylserine/phosphatidylglycerophosphate/cardiolipin synthase family protein [Sphingomonas sp.]
MELATDASPGFAAGLPPEPPPQPVFAIAGSRLQLLDTGPRRLDALLELIAGARRSLRLLYYIYSDDAVGVRVRDAMIAAVERGVAVTLIVDGLGSDPAYDRDFFAPLRAAGGRVCFFVPRWGRRYLLRNHQKIALADGESDDARIIIGGFNIQDNYFGAPGSDGWRDLGLLVAGPTAARMTGYFDALWHWTLHPRAPLRALRKALSQWSEPDGQLRWLLGGPTRRLSPWARAVRRDMKNARAIDILAAYFFPSPAMLLRLGRAARRGGQVRVVVPSITDNHLTLHAARFTYRGLLRRGVRVFEYLPTKLHTKLFVIDDKVQIGSANFDMRSLFLNLEVMLRIDDAAFAAHVRAYVDAEVARSLEVTRELHRARSGFWTRLMQAAVYFVVGVLDYRVTRSLNITRED